MHMHMPCTCYVSDGEHRTIGYTQLAWGKAHIQYMERFGYSVRPTSIQHRARRRREGTTPVRRVGRPSWALKKANFSPTRRSGLVVRFFTAAMACPREARVLFRFHWVLLPSIGMPSIWHHTTPLSVLLAPARPSMDLLDFNRDATKRQGCDENLRAVLEHEHIRAQWRIGLLHLRRGCAF